MTTKDKWNIRMSKEKHCVNNVKDVKCRFWWRISNVLWTLRKCPVLSILFWLFIFLLYFYAIYVCLFFICVTMAFWKDVKCRFWWRISHVLWTLWECQELNILFWLSENLCSCSDQKCRVWGRNNNELLKHSAQSVPNVYSTSTDAK